jgi:hypothetical protein
VDSWELGQDGITGRRDDLEGPMAGDGLDMPSGWSAPAWLDVCRQRLDRIDAKLHPVAFAAWSERARRAARVVDCNYPILPPGSPVARPKTGDPPLNETI